MAEEQKTLQQSASTAVKNRHWEDMIGEWEALEEKAFSKHPAVVGASGSRPSVGQRGHKEIPGSCYGKTKRGSARRSVTPFQA